MKKTVRRLMCVLLAAGFAAGVVLMSEVPVNAYISDEPPVVETPFDDYPPGGKGGN